MSRVKTAEQLASELAFYEANHHCGGCGQPGTWCLCTSPCGCAERHEVGSGIGVDPAVVFADAGPVEQDGLF